MKVELLNSQYISHPNGILDMKQFSRLEPVPRQEVPHHAVREDTGTSPLESAFRQEDLALGQGLLFRLGHLDRFA